MKYGRNYILKPFKVKILRYAKRVCDMHDLSKYLRPPLMKDESAVNIFRIAYIQQRFHMDID